MRNMYIVPETNIPKQHCSMYNTDGRGVNIYIFDSGVRVTHNDFEGRANLYEDFVNPGVSNDHEQMRRGSIFGSQTVI